jgi:WD40 repeat protein/serine/threonine protein kinase
MDNEGDAFSLDRRDQNLLFGVFSVQFGLITKDAFVEATAGWAIEPEVELPERLAELDALSAENCQFVDRLTDEAIKYHRGDPKAALDSVDGDDYSSRIIEEFADAGVRDVLSTILGLPESVSPASIDEIRAVEEEAGRYTTKGEHSRGGMGRILVVHDEFLDRDIALKELLPERTVAPSEAKGSSGPVGGSGVFLARFLREAQVTGQLEHPSIVPVYELGRRSDGTVYYTMKLVRGRTIYEALKSAKNLQERLALLPNFVDLCYAIAYAHSRGVVHRDLKPSNVMLGSFGETVVIDWGIAKVTGQSDDYEDRLHSTIRAMSEGASGGRDHMGQTAAGDVIGTPAYMAPEQIEGRVKDIDARTDVFALGVILYEILSGTLPFTGDTSDQIMSGVLSGKPTPIDRIEPDVPPEIVSICEKAMQKHSGDRVQTAKELAEEVERFQTGAIVHVYQYDWVELAQRFYKEHRTVLNVMAAAASVVLFVVIFSYANILQANTQEREQRDLAERELYASQIHLAEAYIGDHNFLRAEEILWETEPSRRHWEWGYLLTQSNLDLVTLRGHEDAVVRAKFIANGSQVVTYSHDATIRLWNSESGQELRRFEGHRNRIYGLDIDSEEQRIATASLDGTVRIWSLAEKEDPLVIEGHDSSVNDVAFSPEGAIVASASDDRTIKLWDSGTGELVNTLEGHRYGAMFVAFSSDGTRLVSEDRAAAVIVWNADDGKQVFSTPGQQSKNNFESNRVRGFDVASDGLLLGTIEGENASVWSLDTGEVLTRLGGDDGVLQAIRFSPDGDRVVTSSSGGTARVWNPRTGEESAEIQHGERIKEADFSPNGEQLYTFSTLGTLKLWDSESAELLSTLYGHTSQAIEMAGADYENSGCRIVTASWSGNAKIWNAQDPWIPEYLVRLPTSAAFAASSDDATRVIASDYGNSTRVVDVRSRIPVLDHFVYSHRMNISKFGPDGTRIVTTGDGFLPLVLDVNTGNIVQVLAGHEGRINDIAISPDASRVIAAGMNGEASVWDASSGERRQSLVGHSDAILCVAYDRAGGRAATGSKDRTVKVWSVADGSALIELNGHEGPVSSVCFSPIDSRIATGSHDQSVRIWDSDTGEQVLQLNGHLGAVTSVTFSQDGQRILTSSIDETFRIWDTQSGAELLAKDVGSPLHRIHFSSVGNYFVMALGDGSVKIGPFAPWLVQDLPGSPDESWEDRYARYKSTRAYPTLGRVIEPSQATLYVSISSENLIAILQSIAEDLQQSSSPDATAAETGNGIRLSNEWLNHPIQRFGLQEGDVLEAVSGVAVHDIPQAIEELQRRIEQLALTPEMSLGLSIRREQQLISVVFNAIETISTDLRVALNTEHVLGKWNETSVATGNNYENDVRLLRNRMRWSEMGYEVTGDEFPGIWFLGGFAPIEENLLSEMGMVYGDRVMAVDGNPVTSLDDFWRFVINLIDRLEAGAPFEASIQVERGEFQILEIVLVPE